MTTYTEGPRLLHIVTAGAPGQGNISVPGLRVGDVILAVTYSVGSQGLLNSLFYATVTTADELFQVSTSDQSASIFDITLIRW